jgi:amino acid transporter
MEVDRNSFFLSPSPPPDSDSVSSQKLRRNLGYWDGLALIICIMIGSGIFASPGAAVDHAGSIGGALLCWALAGVIVLIASLCYIELATIMPGVGGDFVYLSRAYGKTASFAFAWYYFWISKPGTQAMVASVFGSYFVTIFTGLENADETSIASKAAAVILIILLTLLNCFGIMEALFIVRFFTFVKLALVATVLVSTVAFLSTHSVRSHFSPLPPPSSLLSHHQT